MTENKVTGVHVLKYLMYLMIALVVIAIGLVSYFFATAKVSVVSYQAQGYPATEKLAEFEQVKSDLAQDAFVGTLFQKKQLDDAEDYAFITYTLRLSNQCLVPADMVEVQIVPDPNDVLQLRDGKVYSLDAKTHGDITATILTSKNSHSVREVIVTYYVWGVSFSIRETYGG